MQLVPHMRLIRSESVRLGKVHIPPYWQALILITQCTDNIATTPLSLPTNIFHSHIYSICFCIQSPCTHDVMTCMLRFCGSPNGQGAVNHRTPHNVIQLQPQNRPRLCLLLLLASNSLSIYLPTSLLPDRYTIHIRLRAHSSGSNI